MFKCSKLIINLTKTKIKNTYFLYKSYKNKNNFITKSVKINKKFKKNSLSSKQVRKIIFLRLIALFSYDMYILRIIYILEQINIAS